MDKVKNILSTTAITLLLSTVLFNCSDSSSAYPAGDIYLMVISDVHISRDEDTLYETIPVFETDSFGENDGLPFYLVGLDTLKGQIDIAVTPLAKAGNL